MHIISMVIHPSATIQPIHHNARPLSLFRAIFHFIPTLSAIMVTFIEKISLNAVDRQAFDHPFFDIDVSVRWLNLRIVFFWVAQRDPEGKRIILRGISEYLDQSLSMTSDGRSILSFPAISLSSLSYPTAWMMPSEPTYL